MGRGVLHSPELPANGRMAASGATTGDATKTARHRAEREPMNSSSIGADDRDGARNRRYSDCTRRLYLDEMDADVAGGVDCDVKSTYIRCNYPSLGPHDDWRLIDIVDAAVSRGRAKHLLHAVCLVSFDDRSRPLLQRTSYGFSCCITTGSRQ